MKLKSILWPGVEEFCSSIQGLFCIEYLLQMANMLLGTELGTPKCDSL